MWYELDDFDVRSRYSDIEERIEELNTLLSDMPEERHIFDEKCRIAYLYHDSALDGVVLTYHELRAAVDATVMSDSALLPTYQEISNHSRALDWIKELAARDFSGDKRQALITKQGILDSHIMLNSKLPRKKPGVFRQEMPLHRLYFHELLDPSLIETALDTLCEELKIPDFISQHPINQAVLFHQRFMEIFPFTKASGRIGRLWMNYFLVGAGYPPVIIHGSDRQRYFETLRDGPEALRLLLLDSMDAALEASVKRLREVFKNRVSRGHHNMRRFG